MNTQGVRTPPLRGYRRRKRMLGLDLNVPPLDTRDQEGTSNPVERQEIVPNQERQFIPPATIDVEAIDDDVLESSPRAFAEAKINSRRNRGGTVVVDLDSGLMTGLPNANRSRRRRVSPNQPVINLETMRENVSKLPPSPPLPPKDPIFSCPICMGQLTEEMSTKCGHIFCKVCIKTAIASQAKCPTCRKRVTVRELIRVFLPSTHSL